MTSNHQLLNSVLKKEAPLSQNLISAYNELTNAEKIKFLSDLRPNQPRISYNMQNVHHSFMIPQFFLKEYINCSIENFASSKIAQQLIHYAFYFSLENKEHNFQEKRELIDLLLDNKVINPNSNFFNFPLLHILAISNDVKTIQYLVNLGAKTNQIDEASDSLASSALYEFENLEVFEYVINLPDFNPNLGNNILTLAISRNYSQSIDAIINSKNKILSNKQFIQSIKTEHEKRMFDYVMPQYEKILLEENFEKQHLPNSKIKI